MQQRGVTQITKKNRENKNCRDEVLHYTEGRYQKEDQQTFTSKPQKTLTWYFFSGKTGECVQT